MRKGIGGNGGKRTDIKAGLQRRGRSLLLVLGMLIWGIIEIPSELGLRVNSSVSNTINTNHGASFGK